MIPLKPNKDQIYLYFIKPTTKQLEIIELIKNTQQRLTQTEFRKLLSDIYYLNHIDILHEIIDDPYDSWSECNGYRYRLALMDTIRDNVCFVDEQFTLNGYRVFNVAYEYTDGYDYYEFVIVTLKRIVYTNREVGEPKMYIHKEPDNILQQVIRNDVGDVIPQSNLVQYQEGSPEFDCMFHIVRRVGEKLN
jgi:hypothetical protein